MQLSDDGRITAGAVNLRGGPGVRFAPISQLRGGTVVRIVDGRNGWYRIRSGALRGWVSSAFVQRLSNARAPHRHYGSNFNSHGVDRLPRYRQSRARKFAFIGANRFGFANVFARPGRRSNVVARLGEGERVRVLDRGPRWTFIAKRGIARGYVRSRFLEPAWRPDRFR